MWLRQADREAALRAGLLDRAYAARLRMRAHGDPASWPERDRFPAEAVVAAGSRLAPPGPERAVLVAWAMVLGLELLPTALPDLYGPIEAGSVDRRAMVAAPELLGPVSDGEGWRGRPSRDHRAVNYKHL